MRILIFSKSDSYFQVSSIKSENYSHKILIFFGKALNWVYSLKKSLASLCSMKRWIHCPHRVGHSLTETWHMSHGGWNINILFKQNNDPSKHLFVQEGVCSSLNCIDLLTMFPDIFYIIAIVLSAEPCCCVLLHMNKH